MILSDVDLKKSLEMDINFNKYIRIQGENINIQPASVDLHLGNNFKVFKEKPENYIVIDLKESKAEDFMENVLGDSNSGVIIYPHEFMLATTKEFIELGSGVTAFVEGRSSVGRIGLCVQNAGWVDPGFKGEITLELYNESPFPLRIYPDMRIAQLVFAFTETDCINPYSGKYQNQKGATSSALFKDSEFNNKKGKKSKV